MNKTDNVIMPDLMKKSKNLIKWQELARLFLISRTIDDLEENELVPQKKVLYQFSSRGHELGQILLGMHLTHPHDGISAYYRSRPLMLSLGLNITDVMAAPLTKTGGYSNGRDVGVICNKPGLNGPTVLPMAGDVGSQYTPAVGWAQAINYHKSVLKDSDYEGAIAVVLGGDGSVASNGFWSALTIATTQNLPLLFYIEDNAFGISVRSTFQTPGGNIANNLYSFKNLRIFDGDGTNPEESSDLVSQSVKYVRERKGPVLLRLTMPRLNGHSYQDNQAYKGEQLLKEEQQKDPLHALKHFLSNGYLSEDEWAVIQNDVEKEVKKAAKEAESRPDPNPSGTTRYVFSEYNKDGTAELQLMGGLLPSGHRFPESNTRPEPEKQRINMAEGIRRTLDYELATNNKLLIFGEDVGAKGGVHAVTMGLQANYGEERVFDTSLSEEGIMGRSVGLACSGLMPVPEIQFRKYADPATEQIKNIGTIRWRTANKFAAPMVVRMPGGFAKVGDPWHSESNESFFTHSIGWRIAYPGNTQDAVGLLRTALRGNDPTIFFEHRNLLDARYARRPYPGDKYVIPFGEANLLQSGNNITIVTWGAMCQRCEEAVNKLDISADIIDLRTLVPWDREMVLDSVAKTSRCLIVHEDTRTSGFGAEISSYIMEKGFELLDAPVERHTMPDVPIPHNVSLMNSVLPDIDTIATKIIRILSY